jgi:solute:Na+ symporter, SSS family
MEMFFFLTALSTLMITYFCVGVFASRKVKTNTDYFLAGKSLSVPVITATLLATQIGGGMFLGTAQDPFRGSLYIIGMVIGFLILGSGIAAQLQSFKVTTVGEIFEKKYGSALLHNITSLLSAASMSGIIVGQIVAAKSVLLHFAGIDSIWLFLVFWAFVIAYTMIGGLAAVVITDTLQIIVILTVFSSICIYSLYSSTASFFTWAHYEQAQQMVTRSGLDWGQALKIVTMPIFFSIIEQDLAQRFFAAKSKKAAAISAFAASGLLLIFSFVPFYLGLQVKFLNIAVAQGSSPLLPILKHLTSPLIFALALCALLAAITSTADSLLCAVSAIVTGALPLFNKKIKPSIYNSRLVTLACGIVTLIASYFVSDNIIDVLVNSYEISVSCLFIPLLFCFITKDLRKDAALASAVFGFTGFLFFRIVTLPLWAPYSILITLGLSLAGYGLGFAASPKPRKKKKSTP